MHKAKGKHSLTDPWPHQTEQMLCQLEASTKPPMPQGKVGVGGCSVCLQRETQSNMCRTSRGPAGCGF